MVLLLWTLTVATVEPASKSEWITTSDYPADAASAGEEGDVIVRFDLNPEGAVTACAVVGSSSSDSLDRATCRLALLRARYTPALDTAGRPVPVQITRTIRWTLPIDLDVDTSRRWITGWDYPAEAIRKREEGITEIGWEISETGTIENCHVISSSGSAALDKASCATITKRGRFLPARDNDGNPVRSAATRKLKWELPNDLDDAADAYDPDLPLPDTPADDATTTDMFPGSYPRLDLPR